MKYKIYSTVERHITDDVVLTLEATNEETALHNARLVLDKYPQAHDIQDVPFIYIYNRRHHPSELSYLGLSEEEPPLARA